MSNRLVTVALWIWMRGARCIDLVVLIHEPIAERGSRIVTGVLLDDLLVAGDPSAVETFSVASHLPASQTNKQQDVRKPSQTELSSTDGASVAIGNPVAAPFNGHTSMDTSTENSVSHGHRYFLQLLILLHAKHTDII